MSCNDSHSIEEARTMSTFEFWILEKSTSVRHLQTKTLHVVICFGVRQFCSERRVFIREQRDDSCSSEPCFRLDFCSLESQRIASFICGWFRDRVALFFCVMPAGDESSRLHPWSRPFSFSFLRERWSSVLRARARARVAWCGRKVATRDTMAVFHSRCPAPADLSPLFLDQRHSFVVGDD